MNIKMKKYLIRVVIMSSLTITTLIQAANLTASSSAPSVLFDDTSIAGNAWVIHGYEQYFGVYDDVNNQYTLQIYPSATTGNSLVVDSSGDMNLADGKVFIDRSTGRVGIGTTTPEVGLHIAGSQNSLQITDAYPTLKLDAVNVGKTVWSLQGGTAAMTIHEYFNLPSFTIKKGAPPTSLVISKDEGNIGMGTYEPQSLLEIQDNKRIEIRMKNTS